MASATEESLSLNGVNIDQALMEFLKAYRVQEEKDSTTVPEHPVFVRQRRISDNVHALEDIVKGVVGSSIKADKGKADDIIKKLAYELALAEGFKGKPEELSDEQARTYLTQAAGALGIPTLGNKTEFTKNIMNMESAKPGDPLYDTNSPIAQLIRYISTEKDRESKRLNYLNTLIGEKWTMPEYGLKLQGKLGSTFGIPFNATATASEALGEINRQASLEAQQYAAKTGKTYLKNPADITEHYARQAKAAASGLHGRS